MDTKKTEEVYIDGVQSISFVGGVVRCDLGSFSTTEKDDQDNPAIKTKQRLILSPQAFLQVHSSFESLMNKLLEAGVLRRKDDATVAADETTTVN